jgi:hypothetical protein
MEEGLISLRLSPAYLRAEGRGHAPREENGGDNGSLRNSPSIA